MEVQEETVLNGFSIMFWQFLPAPNQLWLALDEHSKTQLYPCHVYFEKACRVHWCRWCPQTFTQQWTTFALLTSSLFKGFFHSTLHCRRNANQGARMRTLVREWQIQTWVCDWVQKSLNPNFIFSKGNSILSQMQLGAGPIWLGVGRISLNIIYNILQSTPIILLIHVISHLKKYKIGYIISIVCGNQGSIHYFLSLVIVLKIHSLKIMLQYTNLNYSNNIILHKYYYNNILSFIQKRRGLLYGDLYWICKFFGRCFT